jgi:hypothetical protein
MKSSLWKQYCQTVLLLKHSPYAMQVYVSCLNEQHKALLEICALQISKKDILISILKIQTGHILYSHRLKGATSVIVIGRISSASWLDKCESENVY